MTKNLITTATAAKLIGTNTRQVQRLIKRGVLVGEKIADLKTAPFLITLKSVNAYIAQQKRATKE